MELNANMLPLAMEGVVAVAKSCFDFVVTIHKRKFIP